jgi:HEAT repeat protein
MNPAKSFPIEQSYINLAIVTAKEQHEKEKQLCDAQHDNVIMGTFEEIYGMKTTIDIKDIFKTCKNQEKQVLVFGRAGIGKSAFCRYIAYQWATGSYWSQYELLVLIPLRRLTNNRYPVLPPGQTYSLIDLIKKEIFSYDLSEKDERLLKQQFDAKKTLWILDGYDEIVQNVPLHLECLFEQLLKTPHHILTSRPYLNTLLYDVQIEITGFADKNIEEYVLQFFNQMKDELDNASIKSQTLLTFLKSNPSIWGVAHIPVNLELICSLWSNEDWSKIKDLTITALYTMMTEWLCRRYLRTQDNHILQLSEDEIGQRCQKELTFLENLAFNAMEDNTIIIRPSLLKKALNEAQVSSQEHPHILNIGILKSFNKRGTGTRIEMNKDHYFVHLSFQEYFAARYLTSALKGCSTEKIIKFIKHQKYNQRYILVFTFASGILSQTHGNPSTNIFWDAILGKPLDLVGVRHMQLVTSCLEETYGKSTLPRRTELLQWVSECIKFSFIMENTTVWRHLVKALRRTQSVVSDQLIINVFANLLQCNDINVKLRRLLSISQLNLSNPSTALITLMITILTDEYEPVKAMACEALGAMGEKAATNEVVSKLVSVLGDETEFVRLAACSALGKMGEKAAMNEVINKLVSLLGDESKDVRSSACSALGKMGEKVATNEVINNLVSVLEDESEDVRSSACSALGRMGEKVSTKEVINKLVRALGDENEDVRVSACEVLEEMGEKTAMKEVKTAMKEVKTAMKEVKTAMKEVISKLVSELGDENTDIRLNACVALRNMGEKAATNEVIMKLVSTLVDESEIVRVIACEALEEIGEKAATNEVISNLMNVLGDESEDVRSSACSALGKMSGEVEMKDVISKLVSTLEDENKYVRASACTVLGKMSEKATTNEVISKLVNALEDESEDVRSSAFSALEEMGERAGNEVINKLVSTLGDENEHGRVNACYVLGKIGEKIARNQVIRKIVGPLEDESGVMRYFAYSGLEEMGEKAGTNEVINKLMRALEDENKYVRVGACYVLGNMGEKAATNEVISKLVNALEDESEDVTSSAFNALEEMGERARNEVINKLVSTLGDENEHGRVRACEFLGEMGKKIATNEVIGKLVSALGDESKDVSRYACIALGKMGEKAATNEVMNKLVVEMNDNRRLHCREVALAVEKIISRSTILTQLDPKIISVFCLCDYGSDCLKNVSRDYLINFFLTAKIPDGMSAVTQIMLVEGIAVTATEDKVVIYDKKEPLELFVPSLELQQQLFEALTKQAKRRRLYFEIPSEA